MIRTVRSLFESVRVRAAANRHPRRHLSLERLEERVQPSIFSQTGNVLTVLFDRPNESLTLKANADSSITLTDSGTPSNGGTVPAANVTFSGNTAIITTTGVDAYTGGIQLSDGGTQNRGSVTFADSGSGGYTDPISITLTSLNSGDVTFDGFSTFNGNVSITSAGGTVAFNDGSMVNVLNTANLSLTAASDGIALGTIHTATGSLSVVADGDITQNPDTSLRAGGPATFNVTGTSGSVLLDTGANSFTGPVTIGEVAGGNLFNVGFRNGRSAATLPTIGPLGTPGAINNLELVFDGTGIALPGMTVAGSLMVTAGGPISQTGPLASTMASFTVLGNSLINLSTSANTVTGAVGFDTQHSSQPLAFTNTTGIQIGTLHLGRGPVNLTAQTGNISSAGGGQITQEKGASPVTFNVVAGTQVDLDSSNDFSGKMIFMGNALATLTVANSDALAKFTDLTIPSSVNDLTLLFDNAPVVLPTLNLTNLDVTGVGVTQASGATLTVSNNTIIRSDGPVTLPGANALTNLRLKSNNSAGLYNLLVNNNTNLNFFGNSMLKGLLTVKAVGNITQSSGSSFNSDSFVNLSTTNGGNINLNQNNALTGPLSVNVSGASTVNVRNGSGKGGLELANVTTGMGTFSASADRITQVPGTTLTLGGASTFVGTTGVILENPSNTYTGAVSVNNSSGGSSITSSGAVNLSSSSVTGGLNVMAGGAITLTGNLFVSGNASFNSGTAAITLPGNNQFGTLSLTSVGSAAVSVSASTLQLDKVALGAGTLTLTTPGSITQTANGFFFQGEAGAISLTAGTNATVSLNGSLNYILGNLTVATTAGPGGNISIRGKGDLTFTALTPAMASLTVNAGGTVTLPAAPLSVTNGLNITANRTNVEGELTAGTGGAQFTGTVDLMGNRSITTTGDITFDDNVIAEGNLTLGTGPGGQVTLEDGTWNQGSNNLTLNGTGASLTISSGASFAMTGGTISLTSGATVDFFGTFQVGSPGGGQTVTLNNGTGTVTFEDGAVLQAGLGNTNAQLVKQGTGNVVLQTGSTLSARGLAGSTASPVLTVTGGGGITGTFAGTTDGQGNPQAVFAGSDVIQATYTSTAVNVVRSGTVSPTGTVTGFSLDGDRWTVTSSLGASAGLVVLTDASGELGIVVRNSTASGSSTLAVSTAVSGGDGFTGISGIAVHSPGGVTINAPSGDLMGNIQTTGTLTSLTLADIGSGPGTTKIEGGGPVSGTTTITAGTVSNADVTVPGTLTSFKAVSVSGGSITAGAFGSVMTTGSSATLNPGDFSTRLTSRSVLATSLSSAVIAGTLTGVWDLGNNVGSVRAQATSGWTLGVVAVTSSTQTKVVKNVASLNLGLVNNSTVHAMGSLASLTATEVNGAELQADSFGAIKVTGSSAANLVGALADSMLLATDNAGGAGALALGSLSVSGNLINSQLRLASGNAGSISVGRSVTESETDAAFVPGIGNIGSFTAGAWDSSQLTANSAGSIRVTGNLAAGLFGDFINSTLDLRGNAGGAAAVALGAFSANGNVAGSSVTVVNGNVSSFTAAGQIQNSAISLTDPVKSALGSFTAGDVSGSMVTARSIGTFRVTGTPATFRRSPSLPGDLSSTDVVAFQSTGTTPAISSFTVSGNAEDSSVYAGHGITSLTVGRTVQNTEILATDMLAGNATVGRLGSVNVGAWITADLTATSLGALNVKGFTTPESATAVRTDGNLNGGAIIVNGPGSPVTSLGVSGSVDSATIVSPAGITAMNVAGNVNATTIRTLNASASAQGALGSLTAARISNSTLQANSIGTLKTIGSAVLHLLGTIDNSTVSVSGTGTNGLALGTLFVAGDFQQTSLNAPGRVQTVTIAGGLGMPFTSPAELAAGYASGAHIDNLTAASSFGATVTAFSITNFRITGNAGRRMAGSVLQDFIDVIGNVGNVGLGFSATGNVSNSTFNVSDGNVTSFTVARFLNSNLLVGFRLEKLGDVTAPSTAADWSPANRTIGTFKTTALFSPAVPGTASFVGSDVVAAVLGTVSLSGVGQGPKLPDEFGVAFRTSAGAAAKGSVFINGQMAALSPRFTSGAFHYLGEPG